MELKNNMSTLSVCCFQIEIINQLYFNLYTNPRINPIIIHVDGANLHANQLIEQASNC